MSDYSGLERRGDSSKLDQVLTAIPELRDSQQKLIQMVETGNTRLDAINGTVTRHDRLLYGWQDEYGDQHPGVAQMLMGVRDFWTRKKWYVIGAFLFAWAAAVIPHFLELYKALK